MGRIPGTIALLLLLAACGGPEQEPLSPGPTKGPAAAEPEPDVVDVDREALRAERREERERSVRVFIQGRGVDDAETLRAMRAVPRHRFVPDVFRADAYADRPLPIGHGQTISQPYIVASMTEELRLTDDSRVLEIGTGSGYQAAVLAEITPHVYTIEIKEPLYRSARRTLTETGYTSVRVRHGDGYHGWQEEAPFDAIIVTAAAPHIPPPLVRQLKPGGRMIIPVGAAFAIQDLVRVTKDADGTFRTRSLYPVRFVPLTGSVREKEH
ncbi:MAG: protein-L-isoaspartate(D-aspartate) O-methyltransferase [Planctomycetota bacterium]